MSLPVGADGMLVTLNPAHRFNMNRRKIITAIAVICGIAPMGNYPY